MKRFAFLTIIGIMLISIDTMAFSEESPDTRCKYRSYFKGRKYDTWMPSDILAVSPDFDTANPVLPKSIIELSELALVQLETITESKKGWQLKSVVWNRAYPNEKKWICALNFVNHGDSIQIAITIDGRVGIIKEI